MPSLSYTVIVTVLSHPHRVSKRETKEFEYKKDVYQLAREHEKVCELPSGSPLLSSSSTVCPRSLQAAELSKIHRYYIPTDGIVDCMSQFGRNPMIFLLPLQSPLSSQIINLAKYYYTLLYFPERITL